ncbi:hypothetical protein, partial [Neorhizobium alkalisoli]|uniref:hypothetical protein n=1 Tax=Neorhizobium alkalisoli TaxID=528178 RepID=UPI001AEE4820
QDLDHYDQHKRYLKAGHFSVETPGQLSVEINTPFLVGETVALSWSPDDALIFNSAEMRGSAR